MALEVRRTAEGLQLDLTGEWGMREFATISAQLAALDLTAAPRVRIVTRQLTSLEL